MTTGPLAMLGLIALTASAAAQTGAPMAMDRPVKIGNAEAVCTGIGLDARENPAWRDYPLKVEIAGRGGQYLGDVQVVLSKDGAPVAELVCSGPWVLFRVAPGRYRIEARTEGKSAASAATVPASGQGRVILRFPDLGGEIGAAEQPAQPQ